MKKTYIQPELHKTRINITTLLSSSPGNSIETDGNNANIKVTNYDEADEFFSRGSNSIWDDED